MHQPNHTSPPQNDGEFLYRYARENSETAFGQIIERYRDLVFSVCFRELRDSALAEDATQVVFLLLARKARSLVHNRDSVRLAGWLFQTGRLVCRNMHRQRTHRLYYEKRAAGEIGYAAETEANALWESIEPHLQDALNALRPSDREAVLLRFFQGHEFAEIGRMLAISEDAARMRVKRALTRMRDYFAARGIRSAENALPTILVPHRLLLSAPAGCQGSLATLIRTWTLAHTVAPPAEAERPQIYRIYHGVIRTMRFRNLRITAAVALSLCAVGGVLILFAWDQSPLRAAVSRPPEQTQGAASPRAVLVAVRLIERVTEPNGTVREKLLYAPKIVTQQDMSGTLTFSGGTYQPGDWSVEVRPHINGDGSISLRLVCRNEDTSAPGDTVGSPDDPEEKTGATYTATSQRRVKSGEWFRVTILKGPRAEFLLEASATESR